MAVVRQWLLGHQVGKDGRTSAAVVDSAIGGKPRLAAPNDCYARTPARLKAAAEPRFRQAYLSLCAELVDRFGL